MPEPSSIDTAPSRPTLSMARATRSPMERSLLAEIAATWAISCDVVQGCAMALSSATTASMAVSMPRFRSIGFMPAARYFSPSWITPCASTVAVVVPSPAISLVREATSRSNWAPMFSNRSSSSIERATTTPEFTICGGPKSRSNTTVRPRGPSVTFTASASRSTPRRILSRASCPNTSCLAGMVVSSWIWGARTLRSTGNAPGVPFHEGVAWSPSVRTLNASSTRRMPNKMA